MALPKSLLVAVDGSDHADAAASFAGVLAGRVGAECMVATVVPEKLVVAPSWVETLSRVAQEGAIEFERAMELATEVSHSAAKEVERAGAGSVQWTVEVGDPAEAIVSLAERYLADLIVMGRRGTGNVGGLLLGSVSTKVGHLSELTVATVHADGGASLDRILVAVDGSDHSDRAVVFAAELAARCEASLVILHVVPSATMLAGTSSVLIESGGEVAARAERLASQFGAPKATVEVRVGHPADAIVEYASQVDADAICIGRRGLGNIQSLLLGSVSHAVGHLADQAVMTVR